MDPSERRKKMETARSLEEKGKLQFALEIYKRIDAQRDAARILARLDQHAEAGKLLLKHLGTTPGELRQLDPEKRKDALMAASYLAKGGQTQTSVALLVGLGEYLRAADLLERSGDLVGAQRLRERRGGLHAAYDPALPDGAAPPQASEQEIETAGKLEQEGRLEPAVQLYLRSRQYAEAGRCLRRLGRLAEAGQAYREAGRFYQAGLCFLEAGEAQAALDQLVAVQKNSPEYRDAAVEAIRLASDLDQISFRMEHFLGAFVAPGPQDAKEVEAFQRLADLYEKNALLENAAEVLAKILSRVPASQAAADKLGRLEAQTRISPESSRRILQEDSAFLGDTRLDSPPSSVLPSIPSWPRPSADDLDGRNVAIAAAPTPKAKTELLPSAAALAAARPEGVSPFAVGGLIDERYLLHARLGSGGMATVFRASDLMLDEEIALKVFKQPDDPQVAEETLARFKQELKVCRRLRHPNIVSLFDFGIFQGYRYITMELLNGNVLEELLVVPMAFEQGLGYLLQVCAGVQAAHDQGVIHRDIKPANLFVTQEDIVKVMDFGIAKNMNLSGVTLTGVMAGTPEYMSPEQIDQFSKVTPASDLYNIGLVAYRMFAGRLPFEHTELIPLLMMHKQQLPESPRTFRPDMPEELERVILRLIEKDPPLRHAGCGELARDLRQIRFQLTR